MRWGYVIAVLFICLTVSLAHAQPSIVFEEESYDFGEVIQTERPEHTFVFKNTGTEVLVIQKVTSS
ncbi:MAG: DUF1573 domain-containing protein [Nitrospirae bacterium]|nr:MAG: DUF1573 domain-containing protein [Nitrospirota bacterium]